MHTVVCDPTEFILIEFANCQGQQPDVSWARHGDAFRQETPPAPPQWLQETVERLPAHLNRYSKTNLNFVRDTTWVPSGLSSETAAIATALGRGIVEAPELRQMLVELLETREQQRLSEMMSTTDAVVVEAPRALSRDGREQAYSEEIAVEGSRLFRSRSFSRLPFAGKRSVARLGTSPVILLRLSIRCLPRRRRNTTCISPPETLHKWPTAVRSCSTRGKTTRRASLCD